MQNELDGAISALNQKDIDLQQANNKDGKLQAQADKFNAQISNLNENLKKANITVKKHEKHI